MANIRTNKEQERALAEVTASMELLGELSQFLDKEKNCKMVLSYEDAAAAPRARKTKVVIPNKEKYTAQVRKALDNIAKRAVKEVRDSLRKFPIELDAEEEALLARFSSTDGTQDDVSPAADMAEPDPEQEMDLEPPQETDGFVMQEPETEMDQAVFGI